MQGPRGSNGLSPLECFASGRAIIAKEVPYFYRAVLKLTPVLDKRIPTLCVTEKWVCICNPDYLTTMPRLTVATAILHELLHPMLKHFSRVEALGATTPPLRKIANCAEDACINELIKQMGKLAPEESWIYPETLKQPPGLTFEQRYDLLIQEMQKEQEKAEAEAKAKAKERQKPQGEKNKGGKGESEDDRDDGEGNDDDNAKDSDSKDDEGDEDGESGRKGVQKSGGEEDDQDAEGGSGDRDPEAEADEEAGEGGSDESETGGEGGEDSGSGSGEGADEAGEGGAGGGGQGQSGEAKEEEEHRHGEVGHGNCGSGAAGETDAIQREWDEKLGKTGAERAQAVREFAQAVQEYEAKHGAGSIPGGLVKWASEELKPAKVRWEQKLGTAIRGMFQEMKGDKRLWFREPNRMQAALGFGPKRPRLPATYSPKPNVAFAVDTTGSMGTAETQRALAEGEGVCRAQGCNVFFFASEIDVTAQGQVKSARDMIPMLKGGGGTDFRPLFREVAAHKPQIDLMIFVTDGCGPCPVTPPDHRMIWVLVGPYQQKPYMVPDGNSAWSGEPCNYGDFIEIREDLE